MRRVMGTVVAAEDAPGTGDHFAGSGDAELSSPDEGIARVEAGHE